MSIPKTAIHQISLTFPPDFEKNNQHAKLNILKILINFYKFYVLLQLNALPLFSSKATNIPFCLSVMVGSSYFFTNPST